MPTRTGAFRGKAVWILCPPIFRREHEGPFLFLKRREEKNAGRDLEFTFVKVYVVTVRCAASEWIFGERPSL